jgi:hypothetical protein
MEQRSVAANASGDARWWHPALAAHAAQHRAQPDRRKRMGLIGLLITLILIIVVLRLIF